MRGFHGVSPRRHSGTRARSTRRRSPYRLLRRDVQAAVVHDRNMEMICDASESGGDVTCVCRPSTPSWSLVGVQHEHLLLGVLQLAIAVYLLVWLGRQQRNAVSETPASSSLLVLPVYAKFLRFEAWQCGVWGIFFLWQAYYDVAHQVPRSVIVLMQLARYGASFTWALCGEGVFIFLCLDAAGIESLNTAVRLGAAWGVVLVGGCTFLWLSWAGCAAPPDDDWMAQALWVGAWVPYWMRLCLSRPRCISDPGLADRLLVGLLTPSGRHVGPVPLLYGPAALLLCTPRRRQVAWERGALLLCLYNLAASVVYLAPKLCLGVFTQGWLLEDAISIPLAWLLYVPFLAWVLQRDSAFWLRCGFTACVLGDRGVSDEQSGAASLQLHRVPLLARRASSEQSGPARFMVIDPASLRFRRTLPQSRPMSTRSPHDLPPARPTPPRPALSRTIGRGATSVVSAATLYGEPVAVKQMQVKQLTRTFATVFLTEAECLSHCRHPHIVRFVGGCVSPPLVCLVMEVCDLR